MVRVVSDTDLFHLFPEDNIFYFNLIFFFLSLLFFLFSTSIPEGWVGPGDLRYVLHGQNKKAFEEKWQFRLVGRNRHDSKSRYDTGRGWGVQSWFQRGDLKEAHNIEGIFIAVRPGGGWMQKNKSGGCMRRHEGTVESRPKSVMPKVLTSLSDRGRCYHNNNNNNKERW